jgi:hypothetical protein
MTLVQVFKPWKHGGDFILVLLSLSVVMGNSAWYDWIVPLCSR